MTLRTLREIAVISYGKALPAKLRDAGNYPVYGSNGIVGTHSSAFVGEPTIIIGRKGSVGELHLSDGPCSPIDTTFYVKVLDPKAVDIRYLFYAMKGLNLKRHIIAVGVPGISREDIYAEVIAVPPVSQQRQIVDILDRASGIQRLRKAADETVRELVPALFVDMFGDPETNRRSLPVRPLCELAERIETGKNVAAGSGASVYRILKVSSVTSGEYIEAESKPAPDDIEPVAHHRVAAGDFLFSRANTLELVGATAIVQSTAGAALLPDKLWRIVWSEQTEKWYMWALLNTRYAREALGRASSGTSASMRNISQERFGAIRMPIAPPEEQRLFSQRLVALRSSVELGKTASVVAQKIASSLSGRMLAG